MGLTTGPQLRCLRLRLARPGGAQRSLLRGDVAGQTAPQAGQQAWGTLQPAVAQGPHQELL